MRKPHHLKVVLCGRIVVQEPEEVGHQWVVFAVREVGEECRYIGTFVVEFRILRGGARKGVDREPALDEAGLEECGDAAFRWDGVAIGGAEEFGEDAEEGGFGARTIERPHG
jgi:hypothetical protein